MGKILIIGLVSASDNQLLVAVVMNVIVIKIEAENETGIVTMNHRTRDLKTVGRELIQRKDSVTITVVIYLNLQVAIVTG